MFSERLEDLSRLVNFGALTGFLLLHLAVVNHFMVRNRSRAWFPHWVSPTLGFIVIAFVIVEMDRLALTFGSIWIALGCIYYVVVVKFMKRAAALGV